MLCNTKSNSYVDKLNKARDTFFIELKCLIKHVTHWKNSAQEQHKWAKPCIKETKKIVFKLVVKDLCGKMHKHICAIIARLLHDQGKIL